MSLNFYQFILLFFLNGIKWEVSSYLSWLAKYIAKISFENCDVKKLWGGVQLSISDLSLPTWINTILGVKKCLEEFSHFRKILWWIPVAVIRARNIWMRFVFIGIITVVTHLLYTCYRLNMTSCMKKCTSVAWKNGPVQLIRRYIPLLYLLYSFFFHWYWCFSCTLKLVMNSGLRNEWEMLQFFKPFMGVKCLKYRGL